MPVVADSLPLFKEVDVIEAASLVVGEVVVSVPPASLDASCVVPPDVLSFPDSTEVLVADVEVVLPVGADAFMLAWPPAPTLKSIDP